MIDTNTARELVGYCGIYCGSCGMYRGRVYAMIAREFLEVLKAAGYPGELTINREGVQPDFDYDEFLKGVEYFCKEGGGAYCQEPCRRGGGVPCAIPGCVGERGFEVCHECGEYPCGHFAWTPEEEPEKRRDHERFNELGFEGWLRFHAERAENRYANATGKCYPRATMEGWKEEMKEGTNEGRNK